MWSFQPTWHALSVSFRCECFFSVSVILFSVDLDCCQQLGRVHGWTSWHWLWAAGVYPSGRHDICQIVTTVCFIFVPQAFLVLLSYIQLIIPACLLIWYWSPFARKRFVPVRTSQFPNLPSPSVRWKGCWSSGSWKGWSRWWRSARRWENIDEINVEHQVAGAVCHVDPA